MLRRARDRSTLRRVAVGLAAALALPLALTAGPGPLVAAADLDLDSTGARATARAVRIEPEIAELVTVYDSGALDASTRDRALAAAREAGAQATVRDAASLSMQRIRRGTSTVQAPPSGLSYPMGTTVIDRDAVGALMGSEVSGALDANRIVMSSGTASLRGARSGDVVTLRSVWGADVDFTIGAVVDDAITGGTELLMAPEAAARLSLSRPSSVVVWGFDSREAIDAALSRQGLVSTRIRIRRSWDPADPDDTIGMGRTKQLLGEFAFRVNSNGSVTQEYAWQVANLPSGRRLLNPSIAIRARCHLVIEPAIRAALAEAAAVGVGGVFDVGDANIAGGCHNPRFNTLSQSRTVGFLSRHSWGMAIDTNTRGSCQGCAPPDFATDPGGCTAVRIFRKHGFAWGGNFLTPDGMHFEWVGERRDQLPYPSRFCPNVAGGALIDPDAEVPFERSQRPTIFADAGLIDE